MGFGGMLKKAFKSVKLKKREFDPEKLDINDITLPKIIEDLDRAIIVSMAKEEVATYKSLGYKDKTLGALEANSYHSFQIGVLLRYYKLDLDLFIPNKDDIFNPFILNQSREAIQEKIFDIVERYDKIVPKEPSSMTLTTQLKWSPLEAGYLLYFLSTYKE